MRYKINAEFTYSEIRSLVTLCYSRAESAKEDMRTFNIDLSATVEYYDRVREKLVTGLERIDED